LLLRSAARQQLLDSADRVAVPVEETVDPAGERDVGGPVVTAVAGALERLQLREAALPIAEDVLRHVQLGRKLTDGSESRFALAGGVRHCAAQPPLAIRSRMI
jgi:hypothetical protein